LDKSSFLGIVAIIYVYMVTFVALYIVMHLQIFELNDVYVCRFLEKFPLCPGFQQEEVILNEVAASLGK